MTKWTMRLVVAALVLAPAAWADDPAKVKPTAKVEAKVDATYINPADMKWVAAPPDLPSGAQIAVLHGDPTRPGSFTIRFKMPDGYKIAPHWHTQDEHLTVISGLFILHMGDSLKGEGHSLSPGAYHFLPGSMHHAAEAKGETVLQVHGVGPFDIHYVNPADNPNPRAAELMERPKPARR